MLPVGVPAPLSGAGVLAYAPGQVDAGVSALLDDFYSSVDALWKRQAYWYLSDAEPRRARRALWHRKQAANIPMAA
jgi:hypothetical protein